MIVAIAFVAFGLTFVAAGVRALGVVVAVHAASVNAADWKVRLGDTNPGKQFPYILGRDFSGTVARLGEGVEGLAVGDPVFGVCETERESAYAEQVAIAARIVAPDVPMR